MNSFTYQVPTKVIFGRETEGQVGEGVKAEGGTSVLVLYGGGSAVSSGLLDRVTASLTAAGLRWYTLGGIQPNPLSELAQRAVDEYRGRGVDFLLAVGGGSVIDTAKAVAIGLAHEHLPVWDFFLRKAEITAALPVGVVLTIAAAGSETSDSAVLTHGETHEKRGVNSPLNRPRFAILNPELTYTLPAHQTACGVVDIFMHTLDRYFSEDGDNALTDAIAQALLRTVIAYGQTALAEPANYKARSELMWCGSLSHNDLTGLGQTKDFSVHALGHELSAKFDVFHGESLSALWGTWARYVFRQDPARFAQYGRTVWAVKEQDDAAAALEAIAATETYFRALGMPVSLGECVGVQGEDSIADLARRCAFGGTRVVGSFRPIHQADMAEIYRMANY